MKKKKEKRKKASCQDIIDFLTPEYYKGWSNVADDLSQQLIGYDSTGRGIYK